MILSRKNIALHAIHHCAWIEITIYWGNSDLKCIETFMKQLGFLCKVENNYCILWPQALNMKSKKTATFIFLISFKEIDIEVFSKVIICRNRLTHIFLLSNIYSQGYMFVLIKIFSGKQIARISNRQQKSNSFKK